MYQEEPAYESSLRSRPEPQTYVGRLQLWAEDKLNQIWELAVAAVVPLLQLVALLGIVVALSVVFNIYLRRVMVPRALIHERVYFNYVAESPNAKIRLETALQQWTYVKNTPQIASGRQRRFLKADSFYDIHGVFTIAKSARNYDIGASALTLKTIDAAGDVVAKSVRALIIPYQHPMSLLLESVAYFPWRAVGTLSAAETVDVWVDLMSGYHEPGPAAAPTESVELLLNAPTMDLSHAYITIMPKLRGVVFYMYYYPWSTFLVGCAIVSAIQIALYSFIGIIILAMRYFLQSLGSPEPLTQQYGSRRRTGQHAGSTTEVTSRSGAGGGSAALGVGGAGVGLSRVSSDLGGFDTRYVDAARPPTGNRYRTHSVTSTDRADQHHAAGNITNRGRLSEFVSAHLSTAAAEGESEEVDEDELIDTITADLLSSRDRNKASAGSGVNARNSTNGDNSHLYINSTVSRSVNSNHNPRGLSANHNNSSDRDAVSRLDDWEVNFDTPRRAASSAPHSSAGSVRHTDSNINHSGTASPSSLCSVSVGSPRGVRGAVRDMRLPGTTTPSSTTSSGAYSERSEHDSDSADADELGAVFQNDFFNRFFPFLSRKGSTFGAESSGDKKDR